MRKLFFAAAAAIFATSAMADPNIDMSEITLNNGNFSFDIQSTAIAGAMIQGDTGSSLSADIAARNTAWGTGDFSMSLDIETDNAGAGVHGWSDGDMDMTFATGTNGWATADVSGTSTDISTVAGTFGSATAGFSGDFGTRFRSDDWN